MSQRNRALRRWARVRRPRPRPWGGLVPRDTPDRATRMAEAARWPIDDCLVSDRWRETGRASVVLARRSPEGQFAMAGFLVDLSCLGIKFAIGELSSDFSTMQDLIELMADPLPLRRCDPALAVKILRTGAAYADALGFAPHPDWTWTREIMGDIDDEACTEPVPCGRDGMPVFQAEAGDDLSSVLTHLERQLGKEGFLWVAQLGTVPDA